MKEGDIYKKIKVYDGYKIIKLNKKRIVGYEMVKYSLLRYRPLKLKILILQSFHQLAVQIMNTT